MEAETSNFSLINVNATYQRQRPPSVGMPRHALRRRMANNIQTTPVHPGLGGWGGPQNAQGGAGRVLRRRRIISYNTSILHGCFRGDFGI